MCVTELLRCILTVLMVAISIFDGTVEKGKYINAMCEVKAHYEIEKERERERLGTSALRGKLVKAQSRGSSIARGKLRSYHLHILDACKAQISIDRSMRPRN